MAILTCKQIFECISLQIFSKYPIQKSRDGTTPPWPPNFESLPYPGVGGRFGIFSLKWRERMNLKVPGATLPLGCAILSTRARTVRGVGKTPLGELGLIQMSSNYWCIVYMLFEKKIIFNKIISFVQVTLCKQYLIKGRTAGQSTSCVFYLKSLCKHNQSIHRFFFLRYPLYQKSKKKKTNPKYF